jgi:hypothetical protein
VQDSNPADPAGTVSYSLNIDSPGFSITPASTSATVNAGQSATYTLNLASIGGFTSAVTLTCGVVSGMDGACSLSPATVTLGQTASSVLTVTTKAATMSLNEPPAMPFTFGEFGRSVVAASLAGIFLIFFPKRLRGRYRRLSVLVIGLIAAGLMAACGGSGQATTPPPTTVPGTPAGSYNISVTATPMASTTTSSSTTVSVTLVVQ